MMKVLQGILIFGACLLFFNNVSAQAPQILRLLPGDNAQNVSIQVDLAIEFDQPVQIGEGTVTIRRVDDGSVFEEYDVNAGRVLVFFDDLAQINTVNNFALATSYYVEISEGAFVNLSGDPFAGIGDPNHWNFTTGCGLAPTNRNVTNITDRSATFHWDEVNGATGYEVSIGSRGLVDAEILTNSFEVADLTSNTTDFFRVRTLCPAGLPSVWSTPYYFTTEKGCKDIPPTGLMVSSITDSSALLTWERLPGVLGYSVLVNGSRIDVDTTTTFIAEGLSSGTKYSWSVKALCPNLDESSWTYSSFTTTGPNNCLVPSNLAISSITDSSAVLSWEGFAGAQGYNVLINGSRVDVGTATSFFAEGLSSGTRYSWGVKTICPNSGESVWVYGEFTTTGPNNCLAPSGLIASSITDNSAVLSWDGFTGAQGYNVFINGSRVDVGTTTSYVADGLSSGTRYSWGVKTICPNSGESIWVYGEFTTTGPNNCLVPSGLVASSVTDNSAILSWDGFAGAQGYNVLINGSRVDVGTATSYVASGLSSGTRYSWGVKTICPNSGESVWVYGKFTTTGPNNCLVPSGLVASSITDNSAVLTWEGSAGAQGYSVLINGSRIDVGIATSYVAEGLSSGTRYSWSVKTLCSNSGESPWANGKFITTGANNCLVPSGLMASLITDNSAILSWEGVPGARGYSVLINGSRIDVGTATSFVAEGLSSGTQYSWSVKTLCPNSGESAWVYSKFKTLDDAENQYSILSDQQLQFDINSEQQLENEADLAHEWKLKFSLYPNPSPDEVTINVDSDDKITSIIVINSQGKVLKEIIGLNSTSETIGLKSYGSGIYFIRVIFDNKNVATARAVIN